MWVFGYGSLMYDGWQQAFGCLEVTHADLTGYARSFNKKSFVNWGSMAVPGPTLNVIASPGNICTGMAFRFGDERTNEVLATLRAREGKNFDLVPLDVQCEAGTIEAYVPLYRGRNLFETSEPMKLAAFALNAQGTSGRCRDYIDAIYQHLQLLGIDDQRVSSVWKSLQKLVAQQPNSRQS